MSKKQITIYVDNKKHQIEVNEGQTIMQTLDELGYHIPRLCYHPKLSIEGACRVCIVEVEGLKNYVASCAYPVSDGMKIKTNSIELRRARRDIVELILDNHPDDCHTCERDGNCELQRLAYAMGIRERHFAGEKKNYEKDLSSVAVIRDPNKCVLCGRCVRVCSQIQGVFNLTYAYRGFKTVVIPAYDMKLSESVCSACGQCVNVCPTAAFLEKNYTQELFEKLSNPDLIKVVQFAPSVRAAIGEDFGFPVGTSKEGETVAALRKLGFDYVFDTQFGADLTIMEEANEFLERIKNNGKLPMITSCSAAWIKFVQQFYPEFLDNLSTCKSPMSMLGSLIKTYFAENLKVSPKKILSVAVMCCTAKKYEAARPELKINGEPVVDIVITTRELSWMIKSAGIDFVNIKPEEFDKPLGISSGGGAIFGVTGGVMEAAMRTAYEVYTGEPLMEIEINQIRGMKGIKEGTIDFGDKKINVAVAHGLGNATQLLNLVKKEPDRYHFIEIMGCPGGCIGGGGQPYAGSNAIPLDENVLQKRAEALYGIDRKKNIRRPHNNPFIRRIYKEFLQHPLSEKAHKLLHVKYKPLEPKGIIPKELTLR